MAATELLRLRSRGSRLAGYIWAGSALPGQKLGSVELRASLPTVAGRVEVEQRLQPAAAIDERRPVALRILDHRASDATRTWFTIPRTVGVVFRLSQESANKIVILRISTRIPQWMRVLMR